MLFSEPKIPHSAPQSSSAASSAVSVLFSEPKIPHLKSGARRVLSYRFQCSSASRKFLTTSPVR